MSASGPRQALKKTVQEGSELIDLINNDPKLRDEYWRRVAQKHPVRQLACHLCQALVIVANFRNVYDVIREHSIAIAKLTPEVAKAHASNDLGKSYQGLLVKAQQHLSDFESSLDTIRLLASDVHVYLDGLGPSPEPLQFETRLVNSLLDLQSELTMDVVKYDRDGFVHRFRR